MKKKKVKAFLSILAVIFFLLFLAKDVSGLSKEKHQNSQEIGETRKETGETRKGTEETKKQTDKKKNGTEAEDSKNVEDEKKIENMTDSSTQNEKEGDESESGQQGTPPLTTLPEGVNYESLSNEKKAWWFKRNKEHQPSGADDSIDLKSYDAYYLGNTEEKVIYLTFDCGYENGYTETMLDILKKHNAKACFFVTQTYIRDNPEIVKRMKEEGHQVGNHTVTHKSQPTLSEEEIEKELGTCSSYMKEVIGYDMDPFFRPPMGEYSERTLQITKDMGYKTVFWSIAYLDYDVNNQPGSNYVEEHFRTYYHNGAIPLIHNVSSANCEALDPVLTLLEKEGYRFCTLYELE